MDFIIEEFIPVNILINKLNNPILTVASGPLQPKRISPALVSSLGNCTNCSMASENSGTGEDQGRAIGGRLPFRVILSSNGLIALNKSSASTWPVMTRHRLSGR